MKFTPTAIEALEKLLRVSAAAQITTVLIDEINGTRLLRGADKEQSIYLFSETGIPDIGTFKLGINRVGLLAQRVALLKAQSAIFEIEGAEAKNGEDISRLILTAGKASADFRCCSVALTNNIIKTNNDPAVWEVDFPASMVTLLAQSSAAMSSSAVVISAKTKDTVQLELVDTVNNDRFKTEIPATLTWIGEEDEPAIVTMANTYLLKSILSISKEIIKTQPSIKIQFGDGGAITLDIEGISFVISPIA